MRICRFNEKCLGLLRGDILYDVSTVLQQLPKVSWPYPLGDSLISNLPALKEHLISAVEHADAVSIADVVINSPVANPSKIIGAPVNYQKHLDEVDSDAELHHGQSVKPIERIGLFLKSVSSLVGMGEGIALRFPERRTDHEVELAVVIGRKADRVSRAEALEFVAGYSIGLDISARGSEERSMRKSIDTYSVLGPCLVTPDEVGDVGQLDLELSINGEQRQASNTRHLIFDVPRLIELASSFYTLYPGDIIMTGTPEGVGPVVPGDLLEARIESVGEMSVRFRAA